MCQGCERRELMIAHPVVAGDGQVPPYVWGCQDAVFMGDCGFTPYCSVLSIAPAGCGWPWRGLNNKG